MASTWRLEHLARLRVGVVGAGSVGALVAEALARTGVQHIRLIDFDSVETVNRDRLLHTSGIDVYLARSKVETLARGRRGARPRLLPGSIPWSCPSSRRTAFKQH